jgi:hypothetical protein
MDFDGLLETLPNGPHDAEFISIALDLAAARGGQPRHCRDGAYDIS